VPGTLPNMPAKRKSRTAGRARRSTPSGLPPGFGTVTPYLTVEGGLAALEFYERAFGARELRRNVTPDGKLIHGRVKIGSSIVMLSDHFPGSDLSSPAAIGTTTVTLHVYAKNVDALWDRAVAAGAKVAMPLENQYWGERYGVLIDPFGHRWSLSTPVKMSRAEMEAKRKEAEASFARGEHPSRESRYGDA